MAPQHSSKKAQGGEKRKGLKDVNGSDSFLEIAEQKIEAVDTKGKARQEAATEIAKAYAEGMVQKMPDQDKPFQGAQPLLLRKPNIVATEETERVTAVVCRTLENLVEQFKGVHIRIGDDAKQSEFARELLEASVETNSDVEQEPLVVSLARDSWHSLPFDELPKAPPTAKRLLVYVGTPSKYLSMSIKSYKGRFDTAYDEDRLVVLCKGTCMLPLGTQEQNLFGVDETTVLRTLVAAAKAKGTFVWGHGCQSKAQILSKVYGYPQGGALPNTLYYNGDASGSVHSIDYLVDLVRYLNQVKLASPETTVSNYYDTGLLVSVLTGSVVDANVSLLTDRDGLTMLRESSIGHTMSKLAQVMTVEELSTSRSVYNFFIGDGACRLNGGIELALDFMQNYKAQSITTVFVLNNSKWAIEDNLVADTCEEHHLYNQDFYDLVQRHDDVAVCDNDLELRATVSNLSRRIDAFVQGKGEPSLNIVIIRGIDIQLPPIIGDTESVRKSSEMAFMRDVLANFCEGCRKRVPLYGCSAFEYIQYLHNFLEMPEGSKFQYICAKTDIQAAQMCGMVQPDGKCVLFINDVYGPNSLGESLRAVLSGFGGKQLLVFIWHPSLTRLIDHFHLHRPPMVWPNLGPQLCKYFVRKESDALFVDFGGAHTSARVSEQVKTAVNGGVPLVVVTILPEQERSYVSLDLRVKT